MPRTTSLANGDLQPGSETSGLLPTKQGSSQIKPRADFATRFQPGKSGNPGGRPRNSFFRKRSLKHLRTLIAEDEDRADVVVKKIISKAESGDMEAAVFLRDTVDGVPGKAEGSIALGVAVTVEHVAPDAD